MKNNKVFLDFILKEWLLFASVTGLLITSIYVNQIPTFSTREIEIIFIIAVLFVTVKGLENSGLILRLSQRLEKGSFIPLKLVVTTFFLSMFITNDIALMVVVPVTLLLKINHKDFLVIFEALSANAGSALTPIGNPQNLFIYWFYGIRPDLFLSTIAPFSILYLTILVIFSLFLKTKNSEVFEEEQTTIISRKVFIYVVFFLLLILSVLHILPVWIGIIAIVYSSIFDRNSLKIDYALLLTFIFFFGLAENMRVIFSSNIENSGHIFIFSALISQVISNVPTTLLFAKFTGQWKALLWGSNVGGFGSLVGSLANLIAYKLYISHKTTNNISTFTLKYVTLGYVFFFIGILLYFGLERI
ncbi:inner membrane protein YbiR [bacterium BMS3Abin03]|nr:inner membrane protein YbiR [bacterium BMS3Abin03]